MTLSAQLAQSQSPFLRGFASYLQEYNIPEDETIRGLQKAAAAFPEVEEELQKHGNWGAIGKTLLGGLGRVAKPAVGLVDDAAAGLSKTVAAGGTSSLASNAGALAPKAPISATLSAPRPHLPLPTPTQSTATGQLRMGATAPAVATPRPLKMPGYQPGVQTPAAPLPAPATAGTAPAPAPITTPALATPNVDGSPATAGPGALRRGVGTLGTGAALGVGGTAGAEAYYGIKDHMSPTGTAPAPPSPPKPSLPPVTPEVGAATPPEQQIGSPQHAAATLQALRDPQARKQFAARLSQQEQELVRQMGSGQVNPGMVQDTIHSGLLHSAAEKGLTPDQLMTQSTDFTKKIMQDGQVTPDELQDLLRTRAGAESFHQLANREKILDPNSLLSRMGQYITANPISGGMIFAGIPLLLHGLLTGNATSGMFGAALGAAGAMTGGLEPLTKLFSGITSLAGWGQPMGSAKIVQPGAAAAAFPAGTTGLQAAMTSPATAHTALLETAPEAAKVHQLATPQQMQEFAQAYQQNPRAALASLTTTVMGFTVPLPDTNKAQIQAALDAPITPSGQ